MDLSMLQRISQIQVQIIKYEEPIILALGNLGNLASIITFGRRELRKNVCSWYFICLSVAHLVLLDSFCLTRIIAISTGYDVFLKIEGLCKFRAYLYELSLVLSRYFLCSISVDRWLVTSPHARLRQCSSPRVARWLIIGGVAFWATFCAHAPIAYQISSTQCAPPLSSSYSFFNSITSITTTMGSMLVMIVFSVLTVLNVQSRVNRQIHPTATNRSIHVETQQTMTSNGDSSRQRLKRNIQLIRLSLLQVLLYLLLNSIWAFFLLYAVLIGSVVFTSINLLLTLTFLGRLGYNLLFTYTAITFIIYILASKAFRQECRSALKQWLNTIHRRF